MIAMTSPPAADPFVRPSALRRAMRWGVTLVVLALVAWFAGGTVRKGWATLAEAQFHLAWPWVFAAGALYIAGLAPMALYWQRTLRCLHQSPGMATVVRAYYLGHLGKYVPGKALVAVLRTGVLVSAGCNMRQVVVSVFLETLTFMATGGAMAAVLLTTSGDASATHVLVAAGLALLAGLPVTPPVAHRLAGRLIARRSDDDTAETTTDPRITWRLTAEGVACAIAAWTILGLSLWATVRAVGVANVSPIAQLTLWVEAVTLPVVAGFLSLIPGGLLVRDALQTDLLATTISPSVALVVAALWRLTSIASEIVACAILNIPRLRRTSSRLPCDDTQ